MFTEDNNTPKTFNVSEAIAAQKKLQQEKGYPDFAPRDGVCYRCRKNIYSEIDHGDYQTGIWVEKAASELITGCPHCNRSYCD